MTIEEYLKRHIRYNHLISKEEIIDKLYNLHYPPHSKSVSSQTSSSWTSDFDKGGRYPDAGSPKGKGRIHPKDRPGRGRVDSDEEDNRDSHNGGRRLQKESRKPSDEEEVLCPACGDVEDGTPMIACDICDRWYHWACVGLLSKPQKGKEWICTECSSNRPGRKHFTNARNEIGIASGSGSGSGSGSSSGVDRRKNYASPGRKVVEEKDDIKVTAVIKPRRDADSGAVKVNERRSSNRGRKSPSPSSHSRSRGRQRSSDRESQKKKSHKRNQSESEDDLRYNDDIVGDQDFEPHESDYDDKEAKKLVGKVTDRRESAQQRMKKFKKKIYRGEEDLPEMSRDDLRELSHKEMINATGNRDELEKRLKRHFKKKKEDELIKPNKKEKQRDSKLTEIVEGEGVCKICGLGWDLPDELELGPLYKYGGCQAHLHCLMFSSGLIQGGQESEGIVGFMPEDVIKEWGRGSKLKCCFCKEIYATVGCCQRTCMRTYHLPCGIKYGALNEYYGNFDSYCPLHRSKRVSKTKPSKKNKNYVLTDLGLVPEAVDMESGFDSERYKEMMKKLEREQPTKPPSEEKSEPTIDELLKSESKIDSPPREEVITPPKKEKRRSHSSDNEVDNRQTENDRRSTKSAKRKSYNNKMDSSEEETVEIKKRPGPKSKTLYQTPPNKLDELREEITEEIHSDPLPQREGRSKRTKKSTFGGDIYKSAKDELAKLLEKKALININDTFENLAGTRRRTVRNTSIGEDEDKEGDDNDSSNEATSRSKSRLSRRSAKKAVGEVDDEEDYGSNLFSGKVPYKKRSTRSSPTKFDDEEIKFSDAEDEKNETIESIEEFLTDTEIKEKGSSVEKEVSKGKDSETNDSEEEKTNEPTPDGDDEKSKTPLTPNLSENEFEDAERDSGQENLDQNDGFTDCADLSNVTSDEGTDVDVKKKNKVMFNDEDGENQMDLSILINNLGEDEEIKKYDAIKSIKRFKCPFCPHHSKEKRRVEQHIIYAHKKGNFKKNMARGQKMMIFMNKKGVGKNEKVEAIEQLIEYNESSAVEDISKNLPFFKFSNDDKIDAIQDKEQNKNDGVLDSTKNNKLELIESKRSSNSSVSTAGSSKLTGESYRLSNSSGYLNTTGVIESKRERKKPNYGKDYVWETVTKKPAEALDMEESTKNDQSNEKGEGGKASLRVKPKEKLKINNKETIPNSTLLPQTPEKRESRRKKEKDTGDSDEDAQTIKDDKSLKSETKKNKTEPSSIKKKETEVKETKKCDPKENDKCREISSPTKRSTRRKIEPELEEGNGNVSEEAASEPPSLGKREKRTKKEDDNVATNKSPDKNSAANVEEGKPVNKKRITLKKETEAKSNGNDEGESNNKETETVTEVVVKSSEKRETRKRKEEDPLSITEEPVIKIKVSRKEDDAIEDGSKDETTVGNKKPVLKIKVSKKEDDVIEDGSKDETTVGNKKPVLKIKVSSKEDDAIEDGSKDETALSNKKGIRKRKEDEKSEITTKSKSPVSESEKLLEHSAEDTFECLKCKTKIQKSKETVLEHLKRHRLSLPEYEERYLKGSENANLKNLFKEWYETKTEVDDQEKKKIDKPFTLLFSTFGDYNDDSASNSDKTEDDQSAIDEKAVKLSDDKPKKIVLRIKNVKS